MRYSVNTYGATGELVAQTRATQRRKVARLFEDAVYDMIASNASLDTRAGAKTMCAAAEKANAIRAGGDPSNVEQRHGPHASKVIIFRHV